MDRGTWWAIVHGVAKSQTWLTKTHIFDFKFHLSHNFTSLSHLLHGNLYLYHILPLSKTVWSPHIENKKVIVTPLYSWRNWVSERWNDADPVTWQWSRSVFVLSIHLLSTVLFVYLYFGKLLSWGLNGVLVLKVITDLIWTSSILYISHMANQIIAPVASMQTISST